MTPVGNPRATTQWIRDRLVPVPRVSPVTVLVGSIIPTGFAAYCRIFHPAYRRVHVEGITEHLPVRWRQVAADNGKIFHNLAHWHTISGHPEFPRFHHPEWGTAPAVGYLDHREAWLLASLLSRNTGTPHSCYFAWWEGGFHADKKGLEAVEMGEYQSFVFQGGLDDIPVQYSPYLYFVFQDGLGEFASQDSPNLWWPQDLAWCVTTDIDSFSTLLGGSQNCIDKVLSHDGFEALPVAVDDRFDIFGDVVNT